MDSEMLPFFKTLVGQIMVMLYFYEKKSQTSLANAGSRQLYIALKKDSNKLHRIQKGYQ
jgi:hypothetical protein